MQVQLTENKEIDYSGRDLVVLVAKINDELTFSDEVSTEIKNFINKFSLETVSEGNRIYDKNNIKVLHLLVKDTLQKVIFVGMGNDFSGFALKNLMGETVRAMIKERFVEGLILLPSKSIFREEMIVVLPAMVEGLLLGSYKFEKLKSKKSDTTLTMVDLCLDINDSKEIVALEKAMAQSMDLAKRINQTRDLIITPSNFITPKKLTNVLVKFAEEHKLEHELLDVKDMKKLKMEALLSVGAGSENKPLLATAKYQGNPDSKEWVALVGKGITFDSGGISIKPSTDMHEMKDDMAGAATVLGAFKHIVAQKLVANVIVVLACAENMPSGTATRPGDVVTAMNGKTIEIINTDAEGRMVLADAVAYAEQLGATKVIDVATLTGACVIAFGETAAALVSNNQEFCDKFLTMAQKTGERFWQMPTYEDYKELIKSDVADVKNSGGRAAGTITGGLFIGEFVTKPWIHIDIAGTVNSSKNKGYLVKGPTGVAIKTLVELAQAL